jgi:integrase
LRLLTAQRGGEVFNMHWQDLDLDGGWWTIPAAAAEQAGASRAISTPAIELLTGLRVNADAHLKTQSIEALDLHCSRTLAASSKPKPSLRSRLPI